METRRPRAAWHTAAGAVVATYLLAAAVVGAGHRLVPVPEWLALHLLGGYLTEQSPPYQRPSAGEAVERLTMIMEKLGFAPQAEANGMRYRLCLRHCPFREVAQQHQDVVCALHLGLMQGALAQMRAPVTADKLEPFAEPNLCVAHLTAREETDASAPSADAA